MFQTGVSVSICIFIPERRIAAESTSDFVVVVECLPKIGHVARRSRFAFAALFDRKVDAVTLAFV